MNKEIQSTELIKKIPYPLNKHTVKYTFNNFSVLLQLQSSKA